MAYKDLHEEPFDEGTIVKLEIFEDYAQAWIPTFVMQGVPTICIFDFFAGTGFDKEGVAGSSPIRILEKIREQIGNIFQKKVKIKVFLNEFEPNKKEQKKFELLKNACSEYLETHKDMDRAIELKIFNENFEELFPKLISEIKQFPSLVYLDQNGIKFLSDKYLLELEKLTQTDSIYFVSSSYFKWLGNTDEFKKHVDLDIELLRNNPYKFIHRNIIDQLRKKLPNNSKLKLYPFSIKKGANIFGIIFGAKHPLAVDKFLNIAWKRNPVNGDANFDIDDDTKKTQLDIFGGRKLTKIEAFKQDVRTNVLIGKIKNNSDALNFVHKEGHIGNHAAECLKEMKKNGEIAFDGTSPLITYDNVYKAGKKMEYKIFNK
ncbi:MAG TPA: three-Cys-motif partner protein TcmP [Puia sp.]|jgi:three-Cys-motif partner protein|nr:three-Cys-motif partner protein TcmP [Puia sp.]